MRKTRRNSVSDDSTLHFKLTTFTFLFSYRADKRLITTLHSHTLSVHLELGGNMQRLCHNLFTSRLLESLFCMHFSLYSLYIFSSLRITSDLFARYRAYRPLRELMRRSVEREERCGHRNETAAAQLGITCMTRCSSGQWTS